MVEGLRCRSLFPRALDALKRIIDTFISELTEESIKISKRHRADNVAESHVETAAQHLLAEAPARIFRHLGTIGGILLGAAISNLLSIITTKVMTPVSVSVTTTVSIVGAFLVALHVARE